ncbi:MAG TPA: M3 family metallopeptidase [Casimicrobiaceae bacterium]|nr:M3 family metallopeptidase [Casimicrobiaceae bacterium]
MLIGGLAGAAEAAPAARPTIPVYDAASLTRACADGLAHAATMVSTMATLPIANGGARDLLDRWDRLRIQLEEIEGPVDLTANVSPEAETRAAAESCEKETTRFETDLYQNEALYARIKGLTVRHGAAAKMRKDLLDAFEDTGAALPADKRARLKAIALRLEEIRQEFDRNMRDNQTRVVFSPDELKGLPDDYCAKARRDDRGSYLLGFEYTEYVPFMANAENEDARRRYQLAFSNRGTPKNIELLAEALRLRKEMATLFGLASYADFATRRRMVANPATVDRFLNEVKTTVRDVERREIAELTALKAADLHKPIAEVKLERWDADYYQEKLRKARYNVEQESLRKYFPTEASVRWVMAIASQLYGVRFVPATVPVWHPDVRYLDVFDSASGKLKGGVYIDPFPRAGKFGHAAAWPVRGSAKRSRRTPIAVLVANLNPAGLDGEELETLVHEFGHVMHNVLSDTEYATQAGTTVELDFVEAPSQMFEEWARRKESLALLPQFCRPACPSVDDELLGRLSAARLYGAGMRYSRQHLFAAYDMATSGPTVPDPQGLWEKMEGETPLGYVPGTHFPGTFAHIISGYTAGYYGYMWSQVLALDMLSAFHGNLMDGATGRRFRAVVLAQGSQKPAREMVRTFLGRESSSEAFIAEITGTRSTSTGAN